MILADLISHLENRISFSRRDKLYNKLIIEKLLEFEQVSIKLTKLNNLAKELSVNAKNLRKIC